MTNKFAIYTAIVGNYDEILQPLVVDDRFDYILFSNDMKKTSIGVWQVRGIDYENADKIKIARWVKTHPDDLLHGYEFSLWIDANIQIKTNYIYHRVIELFGGGISVSTVVHPTMNCIYNEMFTVFDIGYETEKTILDWANVLRKNQYPFNNGLHETGILFRIHSYDMKKFNDLWWSCIECYSRRDQLSFNYALWKLGIKCESLLPKGQSCTFPQTCPHFNYKSHFNYKRKYYDRNTDCSLLRRYYLDLPNSKKEIENIYYKIFRMPFPKFWAYIYGQIYRIKFHWNRVKINRGR